MPIEFKHDDGEGSLDIALLGTIIKKDYKPFASEIIRLAGFHGKLSVLLDMTQFEGWDAEALWDEMKFDIRHLDKFECLAVVGNARAQRVIACYIRPLLPAKVAYFDGAEMEAARFWLTHPKMQSTAQAA